MHLQKGGYKLKKAFREKNPSNDEIFYTHIMPLIVNTETRFETLSSDSLFSFVLKMEVPVSISPFVNEDEEPVESLLFKICVIKPLVSSPNFALEKKQPIKKYLLSEDDFREEAFVQQKIWSQSMELGLSDICSALTNVAVIRDHDMSSRIINIVFMMEESFKQYMLSEIKRGNSLGIITMETLSGVSLSRVPSDKYYDCYIKLLAIILRLFFVHGVIHCDLHIENNMFDLNTGKASALDFGRTITVDSISEKINKHGKGIHDYTIKVRTEFPKEENIPPNVEESYQHLVERFEKWHMLKFCFEKGRHELGPRTIEQVKNALWFIINFEVTWMEDVYFADNYSNIRTLLSVIMTKFPTQPIYADILSNYNILTTESKPRRTPVKPNAKVKSFIPVEVLYSSTLDINYDAFYQEFLTIGEFNTKGSLSETFKLSENPKVHSGSTIVDEAEDEQPKVHSGSTIVDEENYEDYYQPPKIHSGSTIVDDEDYSDILLGNIEDFVNLPPPIPSNNKRKQSDMSGGNNKTVKRKNRTKKQPKIKLKSKSKKYIKRLSHRKK